MWSCVKPQQVYKDAQNVKNSQIINGVNGDNRKIKKQQKTNKKRRKKKLNGKQKKENGKG